MGGWGTKDRGERAFGDWEHLLFNKEWWYHLHTSQPCRKDIQYQPISRVDRGVRPPLPTLYFFIACKERPSFIIYMIWASLFKQKVISVGFLLTSQSSQEGEAPRNGGKGEWVSGPLCFTLYFPFSSFGKWIGPIFFQIFYHCAILFFLGSFP